jgi:hypothetical protein
LSRLVRALLRLFDLRGEVQYADGSAEGAEWVPQFVAEQREELVLPAIGLQQGRVQLTQVFFHLLAFQEVGGLARQEVQPPQLLPSL